jgi:hypothetical protein
MAFPKPQTTRAAKLLKFRSSNFDWLVLSGPTKAALKGSTTRKGGFKFLISVIDGDAEGGGGDKIRVKIVEEVGACPLLVTPPAARRLQALTVGAASSVDFALNPAPLFPNPQASGATFYDNQLEGDTADEAPPTAAISSGDILLVRIAADPSGLALGSIVLTDDGGSPGVLHAPELRRTPLTCSTPHLTSPHANPTLATADQPHLDPSARAEPPCDKT